MHQSKSCKSPLFGWRVPGIRRRLRQRKAETRALGLPGAPRPKRRPAETEESVRPVPLWSWLGLGLLGGATAALIAGAWATAPPGEDPAAMPARLARPLWVPGASAPDPTPEPPLIEEHR